MVKRHHKYYGDEMMKHVATRLAVLNTISNNNNNDSDSMALTLLTMVLVDA